MDSQLAARFPFLDDASQMAAENGADIESLISSPSFEDARRRGAARIEEAMESSEVSYVPLVGEWDRLVEVMSYPYARILVSCVGDRFLVRRYALAESVHMNRLLGDQSLEATLAIAKALGVNAIIQDDALRMHFADYLRFSTRIKSQDWKLVNCEVHAGYVYLPRAKFDRLLQNALQDRIESELPLDVPDDIRRAVKPDADRAAAAVARSKSRFSAEFTGELDPEDLPPCIRTLLANAQNGVNLPHSGRFALVSFLHTIGMGSEQILGLFSRSPDFDESKSVYQIKHITGELNGTDGYTPPECGTMKTNGICYGPDELCESGRFSHPLVYFRIKTGGKRRQERPPEGRAA